ncbi:putative sporulation protein YtxC [Clostridium senegalense]|uniref:Putative sporulation protein YtxC n=1 Tax=Clostridium senegalense TaxID=1465809 RepID=A0A6M0GZP5_9CLOT|nr:putative sporulation protein YtxC [Clostridium senegalense]NEU03955.1 putative sporulation protein YtxC [Clostridium senegalense]
MLMLTLIKENSRDYLIDAIRNAREYFKIKGVRIGVSESIENKHHIIKIYCDDENYDVKFEKMFNLYIANILFKELVDDFCEKNLSKYLVDNFYFLKCEDIIEIKKEVLNILQKENSPINENMIYYMNRKNDIVDKIVLFLEENNDINIDGFIKFRMKQFSCEIQDIIEKIVEKFMVEKEYDEFIKLLKYFIDVQESKIDELHIIINNDGNYALVDKLGEDVLQSIMDELSVDNLNLNVTIEDLIISGLITTAPQKVIMHCVQNCKSKELIETIKKVFGDRVSFCDECIKCKQIKSFLKV